jgi:hypothetical protein
LERAKESRGESRRRLFLREEVCFFFVFPKHKRYLSSHQKRQFFRKREKKMLSMTKMLLLRRRRDFSTTPRGVVAPPRGTNNVRGAFFEKNPDAAEAVPLLVFVSTGEWFYVFLFCISLSSVKNIK